MAARGPLPKPNARRRNQPTIPTTELPAAGRKGRAPALPETYKLKAAGRAWWKWAWKQPQAAAWDTGALYHTARRAQLEDDLAMLDEFDPFDLAQILDIEEDKRVRELAYIIGRLKGLAGNRLSVMKEMRELDSRLGLNPEAMAKLRWRIVNKDAAPETKASKPVPKKLPANVRRIRALDPAAAVGG